MTDVERGRVELAREGYELMGSCIFWERSDLFVLIFVLVAEKKKSERRITGKFYGERAAPKFPGIVRVMT